MKTLRLKVAVCSLLLTSLAGQPIRADVFTMPSGQKSLEFVTVGDPGNAADTLAVADSAGDRGGSIGYAYQMGKYDVTAAQYCAFLNAVARTDTYNVYNPYMGVPWNLGCGIVQAGSPGTFTYSVEAGHEDFPVNYVTWGDAARFANWLSNGQPTGLQGPGTTETGSYALNGATADTALMAVTRAPGATYVLPTDDEWHKAAYYKGGSADAGYWLYPTQSDTIPTNILSTTGTNNSNYNNTNISMTNYLTPVGYFAGSPGPYGTFDMGGNVMQWTETNVIDWCRRVRGESFSGSGYLLSAPSYYNLLPSTDIGTGLGLRVALVPEPATLAMLTLGGLLLARRRRA